jgi:hypothetical protein
MANIPLYNSLFLYIIPVMTEKLIIALCFALAHNSTLLPTEQRSCGVLQTDLSYTSMLENPGEYTCGSQQNPCDVTNDNQHAAMDA